MSLTTGNSRDAPHYYPPYSPFPNEEYSLTDAKEAFSQGLLIPTYSNPLGLVQTIKSPEEIEPLMRGGLILRSTGEKLFFSRHCLLGGSPLDDLENQLNNKEPGRKSVFISYQWNQQELARDIHEEFKKRGYLVIRDETNLSQGVYLPGFMRIINHPNLDYVLVVVSDGYLKSKNCMYEVNQIVNRYNFTDTLLPLVITDDPNAKADIYNGVQKYLVHWQDKLAEAKTAQNLADEDVINNIIKNCQTFADAVRTRINIPQSDLISQKFQPFFDMIDQREKEKGGISQEIEALLSKASTFEKMMKTDQAEKSYKDAIIQIEQFAHLKDLDPICAKLYGAYGEFLIRQGRAEEARTNLSIASNFGYDSGASSSSHQRQTGASSSSHQKQTATSKAAKDSKAKASTNPTNFYDFSSLGKPKQQELLAKMLNNVYEDLTIRNSIVVRDASLADFNFSKLTGLELSGCINLTDKVVRQIINQAPLLLRLNLSDNNSFKEIAESSYFASKWEEANPIFGGTAQAGPKRKYYNPLHLKKLQELILNNCPQLAAVAVQGEELSKVELAGCGLTSQKGSLSILAPKLRVLSLKDSKNLSRDVLLYGDIGFDRSKLTTLNIDGCNIIEGIEFLTAPRNELFEDFPLLPQHVKEKVKDIFHSEEVVLDNNPLSIDHNHLGYSSRSADFAKSLPAFRAKQASLILNTAIGLTTTLKKLKGWCVENHYYWDSRNSRRVIHQAILTREAILSGSICQGLCVNKSIVELDLSNCSQCLGELPTVIRSNTSIKKLDISGNQIDCETANHIADALKSNQAITELALQGNPLTHDGVIAILGAIQSKTAFKELKIDSAYAQSDSAEINTRLKEALEKASQSNTSLKITYV